MRNILRMILSRSMILSRLRKRRRRGRLAIGNALRR
jgi:hypothetical protein